MRRSRSTNDVTAAAATAIAPKMSKNSEDNDGETKQILELASEPSNATEIIQKYCTFRLNVHQEKEYNTVSWGKQCLNPDLALMLRMYKFARFYGVDKFKFYEMGKCALQFDTHQFVNPGLYMIFSNFWFNVVHPSPLFPLGCLFCIPKGGEGTQAQEFISLHQDGQFFFCGRYREDKYDILERLIAATREMSANVLNH